MTAEVICREKVKRLYPLITSQKVVPNFGEKGKILVPEQSNCYGNHKQDVLSS